MNKCIGGSWDGKDIPIETYEGDLFKAASIEGQTTNYFRKVFEKNNKSFTFWVPVDIDDSYVSERVAEYLKNV